MPREEFPTLACPCCGTPMPPRRTHRGKPYYVCDPCGVQLFIRREDGITRLAERTGRRGKEGNLWGA